MWCNLLNFVLNQVLSDFLSWTVKNHKAWSIILSLSGRLWWDDKLASSNFIYLSVYIWDSICENNLLIYRWTLYSLRNNNWWSRYNWCWWLWNNILICLRRLENFRLEIWSTDNIWFSLSIYLVNTSLTVNWSFIDNYWFLNGFLSSERSVILSLDLLWNCTWIPLWVSVQYLRFKVSALLVSFLRNLLCYLRLLSFPVSWQQESSSNFIHAWNLWWNHSAIKFIGVISQKIDGFSKLNLRGGSSFSINILNWTWLTL